MKKIDQPSARQAVPLDEQAVEIHAVRHGNELLVRAGDEVWRDLSQAGQTIRLQPGDQMAETGASIDHCYFPEGGVTAIGERLGEDLVASGLVGREGLIGWPALLGQSSWPHVAVARALSFKALRIERAALLQIAHDHPAWHLELLKFVEAMMRQMARTIASNLHHSVEQRTARWILLYRERLDCDEIAMTHRELSIMLGVRRPSITDALHRLEYRGAIKATRGKLLVVDPGLLGRFISGDAAHA
ncbi:Crp/Fnr family transcriptional regulator [Croceicoccus marinus]|uniref:Crp/Fnr family transcriptional regulator n=1 Tax=Croceicoccus marinus TaxID=450378 RepID=A0A7G6VSL0_9SPHN|nr:Crp/Fnr family transcriptional regulator [Croceicoccus marinus]QNE04725.1 Crp/Fnr family transcriptional regulator [Croceicoccus marinus]